MNNQKEQSQIIEGAIEAQRPTEENTGLAPVQGEAEMLISQAINKGIGVESLERLLAMRRELRQEHAKEEFDKSMAGFQADCPTIEKTKSVKTRSGVVAYKYAPIESVVEQVKTHLKTHGFSYSTNMVLLPSGVKVSVKVTHKAGHSEVTDMEVPLGNKTDIMSQSQVVAAAQTFAKRYAFLNAFGILTGDEDNDAKEEEQPMSARTMAQQKENAQTLTRPTNPSSKATTSSQNSALNNYPISKAQLDWIEKQMKAKGITMDAVERVIEDITQNKKSQLIKLTNPEADMLIKRLLKAPNKKASNIKVDEQESEQITDEVAEGLQKQEEAA